MGIGLPPDFEGSLAISTPSAQDPIRKGWVMAALFEGLIQQGIEPQDHRQGDTINFALRSVTYFRKNEPMRAFDKGAIRIRSDAEGFVVDYKVSNKLAARKLIIWVLVALCACAGGVLDLVLERDWLVGSVTILGGVAILIFHLFLLRSSIEARLHHWLSTYVHRGLKIGEHARQEGEDVHLAKMWSI